MGKIMVMRKIIFSFVIFSFLFPPLVTYSKVKSDAFKVDIFDKEIKVISPKSFKKNISVIVTNESLSKIVFKVIRDTGESLGFYTLLPRSFKSIDLNFSNLNDEYFIVPFAPASQKVTLKLGQEAYDIPSKR